MLSVQGILNLLADNSQGGYKRPDIIEQWKDVYYRMSLHIDGVCPAYWDIRFGFGIPGSRQINPNKISWCNDYQLIFESFIFSKYPHESELIRNYRLSRYKPLTQAPFLQVIQVITGAIFQDSGYNVTVNDKADNDYIWGKNFHDKSLINYVSDNFNTICADPNGRFVVAPKEPHHSTTTPKVEPEIWFIPSRDILHISKDEIIFTIGDVYWAVNAMAYHRFTKNEDGRYENMDGLNGYYYAHFLQRVPSYAAGGVWNNRGYYESWLNAARPIADDYASGVSDEDMVMKQASHPFIIEADTECPDCEMRSGWVQTACGCDRTDLTCVCNGTGYVKNKCSTCHGTGNISRNPAERIIAPSEDMDKDLIKIVNPDTSINKLHIDRNKDIFQAMLAALHLNKVEQAQSGVAKEIDMETRYQFILKICNDLFDRLITGLLNDILALRNVTVNNGVLMPKSSDYVIVKPVQFNIKTTYDLLEDLQKAKDSGLPAYQLAQLEQDYVQKQFVGNDLLQKKTEVVNAIDILSNMSTSDKQATVLNNAASNRDWQFNIQLPKLLDKLARERGTEWFLRSSIDIIEPIVRGMFDEVVPPPLDMNEPLVVDQNRAII